MTSIDRLILYSCWFMVFVLMLTTPIKQSWSADLPIPKPRPPVEECVSPDTHPSRRQQITSDATCLSGYRWTNTRNN